MTETVSRPYHAQACAIQCQWREQQSLIETLRERAQKLERYAQHLPTCRIIPARLRGESIAERFCTCGLIE